jgi:L-ascorbate metabolism protein UlaG (beta-lactamase superfamily)
VRKIEMKIQLVRHATLRVELGGKTLLVDPMLAEVASTPPIQNGPDDRKNPLVALPFGIAEVMKGIDAVLVTHTHRDHWDAGAEREIPKGTPILGQPPDEQNFKAAGFQDVRPIAATSELGGIRLHRTGGQHGTGEIGKLMAPVSGFVLRNGDEVLYIAGDTIWCEEVARAIEQHQPTHIVLNAGGAKFKEGDPITMTPRDVEQVCKAAPQAKVIAVHMEAINHCLITRADLARYLSERGMMERVRIPADGEWVDAGSE